MPPAPLPRLSVSPQPGPELHTRKEQRRGSCASITVLVPAWLDFQGLCGTELEWGRAKGPTQVRLSKDPETLGSPEAFPKLMSVLDGLCDLVTDVPRRDGRTLYTYHPVKV